MKLVIITTIDGDLLAMSKTEAMEYILAHGTNSDGSSVATIEEATPKGKMFIEWLELGGYGREDEERSAQLAGQLAATKLEKEIVRLQKGFIKFNIEIERLQDELERANEIIETYAPLFEPK